MFFGQKIRSPPPVAQQRISLKLPQKSSQTGTLGALPGFFTYGRSLCTQEGEFVQLPGPSVSVQPRRGPHEVGRFCLLSGRCKKILFRISNVNLARYVIVPYIVGFRWSDRSNFTSESSLGNELCILSRPQYLRKKCRFFRCMPEAVG